MAVLRWPRGGRRVARAPNFTSVRLWAEGVLAAGLFEHYSAMLFDAVPQGGSTGTTALPKPWKGPRMAPAAAPSSTKPAAECASSATVAGLRSR